MTKVQREELRSVYAAVVLHAMISRDGPADAAFDVEKAVAKADQLLDALERPVPPASSNAG